MEPEAAKLIGAGLAAIAMGGAGIGIGLIFGNYVAGAMRNPGAAQAVFGRVILGFALNETEDRTRKFFSGLAVIVRETVQKLAESLRDMFGPKRV